jgi:ribosomal protein S18 acetylase RimI-like enzyme
MITALGDVLLERRPIVEGDLPFLAELYASTREEELAPLGWSEQQRQAFLSSQFELQHAAYMCEHSHATYELLLVDRVPAGRLYVDRRPSEIRVIDISLLPAFRGRGIGGRLLEELIAQAHSHGGRVVLHVERHNRARMLYERLGFETIEDLGIYLRMEHASPALRRDAAHDCDSLR